MIWLPPEISYTDKTVTNTVIDKSTATSTSQKPKSGRGQQIAAASIIVLLAATAGSYGWWQWKQHTVPDEPTIDLAGGGGGPRGGGGMGRRFDAAVNGGGPPRHWDRQAAIDPSVINPTMPFVTENARVVFAKNESTNEWHTHFAYKPPLVTANDSAIILARMNSQQLQLAQPQIAQLEALKPFHEEMVVSKDDRAAVMKLWTDYLAAKPADRPAIGKTISDKLSEVARNSQSASRALIEQRIDAVRKILTPSQFAKLDKKPQ